VDNILDDDFYWESDLLTHPIHSVMTFQRILMIPWTQNSPMTERKPSDPIHWTNTCNLREKLTGAAALPTVKNTLNYVCSQGINLPLFLHALSWGNESCILDKQVQYTRTSLMVNKELPGRGGIVHHGVIIRGNKQLMLDLACRDFQEDAFRMLLNEK
jgi:hypothetical protein